MNTGHQRMAKRSEDTVLIWLPDHAPGADFDELVRNSTLSTKTVAKCLKHLIGRGKVVRTRGKKRIDGANGLPKIVTDVRYHLRSRRLENFGSNLTSKRMAANG